LNTVTGNREMILLSLEKTRNIWNTSNIV
jgi:hypothetical protein